MQVVTIVGARPQFVKAAVVSRAIHAFRGPKGEQLRESIVHTGQHHDDRMSAVFFREMAIPEPVVNLEIAGGGHGEMTGRMLAAIERELLARRPDLVLVYGDTNSTLAGALAAAKLHIPVAHVEAGLRSFNRAMPEELNRVVTDHVAELLFCPSAGAASQLGREGVTKNVHVVGDVMMDAIGFYRPRAVRPARPAPFVFATIHRAENTDDPLRLGSILRALGRSPHPVVWAVHPRTRGVLDRAGVRVPSAVEMIAPLSYFETLGHLDACRFVVTDSGGLQKEAYAFGKRCLTVRDETEWVELVEADVNRVVGTDEERIVESFPWAERVCDGRRELYGDGQAGRHIASTLFDFLAKRMGT